MKLIDNMKPHLRKDILSSNWVIISDERGFRPNEYKMKINCPFCPGNENETPPEIYSLSDEKGWYLRVVPNKYPAFTYGKSFYEVEGINKKSYLNGIHEVIIEDREHFKKIHQIEHLDKVVETYVLRMKDLYSKKYIKYVMLFRNYGENAGASLIHPHSQIIAMPLLPARVDDEISHFKKYYRKNKKCPMCDVIENERNLGKRIVYINSRFIAFAPFASRFNFEIWIAPLNHSQYFHQEMEFSELASCLKNVFLKLHRSVEDVSYNMIIHTAPLHSELFHWHIEILPKIAMPAGFEWGSGFYINSISPEKAVKILNSGERFKP